MARGILSWQMFRRYATAGDQLDLSDFVRGSFLVILGFVSFIANIVTIPLSVETLISLPIVATVLIISMLIHLSAIVWVRNHYSDAEFTSKYGLAGIWVSQIIIGVGIVVILRIGVGTLPSVDIVPTSFSDGAGSIGLLAALWISFGWRTFQVVRTNPSRETLREEFDESVQRCIEEYNRSRTERLPRLRRQETNLALEELLEGNDVVLTGPGGIGKSGILISLLEEWDGPILAVNASALRGVPHESSLGDHLDLSLHPIKSIERLAQQEEVLLAVDQLDDLADTPRREILEDLLLKAEKTENVRIILTARTARYQNEPFFESLDVSLTLTRIQVNKLSCEEVDSALDELGVVEISPELRSMCRRIINLSIVAQIAKSEDLELASVTSEVGLWRHLRKEIVRRGAPELTDEEAERIIIKAREIAVQAYENPHGNEVHVENPRDPALRALRSWDILTTEGDEYYRFTHPRYQEYFYALHSVKTRRTPTEVIEPLNRSEEGPVIEWVIALYLDSSSQQFSEFLDEALSMDAIPFSVRIVFIEELAKSDPAELSEETYEVVRNWVGPNDEHHEVFYQEIGGDIQRAIDESGQVLKTKLRPDWLEKLIDSRQFTTLTDSQETFLLLHSAYYPELVGRALEQLAPTDQRVLGRGLKVLSNVKFRDRSSAEMVEDWLRLAGEDGDIPSAAWRLFKRRVEQEEWTEAVLLLRILAKLALDGEPKLIWQGTEAVEHQQAVLQLARSAPNKIAPSLREVLVTDVRAAASAHKAYLEETEEGVNGLTAEERMWHISSPISEMTLPRSHPRDQYDVRTIYLLCYREALSKWFETAPDDPDLEREIERVTNSDVLQLRTVGAAVLAHYPVQYPSAVHRLLTDSEIYSIGDYHEPLRLLWEKGFEELSGKERADVAISLREEIPEALSDAREDAMSEDVQRLYSAIESQLISTDVDVLKTFQEERPPPETFTSPADSESIILSIDELAAESDLVSKLAELDSEVNTIAPSAEKTEQEELASTLAAVVINDFDRHMSAIPVFADINAVYLEAIVDAVLQEIEKESPVLDREEIAEFLDVCKSLTATSAPSPDARYHSVRFVSASLFKDSHVIFENQIEKSLDILSNALTPPWGNVKSLGSLESWRSLPSGMVGPGNHPGQRGSIPACALAGVVYLLERNIGEHQTRAEELLDEALTINDTATKTISGALLWRVAETSPELIENLRNASLTPNDQEEWSPPAFAGWLSKPLNISKDCPEENIFTDLYEDLKEGYVNYTLHVLDQLQEENETSTNIERDLIVIGTHLFKAWNKSIEPLPPTSGTIMEVFQTCQQSHEPSSITYVLQNLQDLQSITINDRTRQQDISNLWNWQVLQFGEVTSGEVVSVYTDYIKWAIADETINLSTLDEPLRATAPIISNRLQDWALTEELLASHIETDPILAIDIYYELTGHGPPMEISRFANEIIEVGSQKALEEREAELYEIVDRLAEAGHPEIRNALSDN